MVSLQTLEIFPVVQTAEASFACKPCKEGFNSIPGGQCVRCAESEGYWNKASQKCIKCPSGEKVYPGENKCRKKRECRIKYDAEEIYHNECKNDIREITYKWRENIDCNTEEIALPKPKYIKCRDCPKGSFVNNTECLPCPLGTYSNQINSKECKPCNKGKYAIITELYENFEGIPNDFETYCEVSRPEVKDACREFKGWISTENVLAVHPNLTAGTKLILQKTININHTNSSLSFSYITDNSESFSINIDDNISKYKIIIKIK